MIAFYVQGGGLGHLTRTHKLIQQLQIDAKDVLIITPSPFRHYFKQYLFSAISWKSDPATWSKTLIEQLKKYAIQQCYIDVFPLGMKGELIAVYKTLPKISFIYTCRLLQWKKYLVAMPQAFTPNFTKTIVLETIYENHLKWIHKTSKLVEVIQLPILAQKEHTKLADTPYAIAIHSGGKKDVIDLCKKIQSDLKDNKMPIFVFTQVSVVFDEDRFLFRKQEYPLQQYFKHAAQIYTAAGFNLMHELAPHHKKHTIYPIDRLYDDQFFRTQNRASLLLK